MPDALQQDHAYLYDRAALRAELAQVDEQPAAPKPDPILVVDRIVRRFGGMTAVDVDHLEVQRGAITALIGPNGAGKTTFFNLVTGFDRPSNAPSPLLRAASIASPPGRHRGSARAPGLAAGSVAQWQFDGQVLRSTSPHRVARAGMVRTFQLTKALSAMTVLDNMLLGAAGQRGEKLSQAMLWPTWKSAEKEITTRADELLHRFKLHEKRSDYAGSLSGGQRKLLEMARALMSNPKMIMLDEPMAGVNPALTQSLLSHIQDLRDQGTTVLFVEHDMHVVRHISDWVVVMAEGRVVAEGQPGNVMKNQAVVDAYLGAHHDQDLGDDALLDEDFTAEIAAEEAERAAQEEAAHEYADAVRAEQDGAHS